VTVKYATFSSPKFFRHVFQAHEVQKVTKFNYHILLANQLESWFASWSATC